jgi:hypothetical protein
VVDVRLEGKAGRRMIEEMNATQWNAAISADGVVPF